MTSFQGTYCPSETCKNKKKKRLTTNYALSCGIKALEMVMS